jgi:hypothetical protein
MRVERRLDEIADPRDDLATGGDAGSFPRRIVEEAADLVEMPRTLSRCRGCTSGPISVSGSSGWPILSFAMRSIRRDTNSSWIDSWMSSRLDDVQRSPFRL